VKDLTKKECIELLAENYIGRIAFISKGSPDILPVTYYYDEDTHSIITYSGEGGKIDAMRKNGEVSFQVDEITALDQWKSVLLYGEYEELSGIDAKHMLHEFADGVKEVILKKEKVLPQHISEFSSKVDTDKIPVVYRINIAKVKGKRRD
jgi:nitroimidazol reductase NimA-like FMN-containing flavoprotein (pyridoxamine 5'-phosphate oxidase superfamily)